MVVSCKEDDLVGADVGVELPHLFLRIIWKLSCWSNATQRFTSVGSTYTIIFTNINVKVSSSLAQQAAHAIGQADITNPHEQNLS